MNWEAVGGITGVVIAIASVITLYVSLTTRLAVTELKGSLKEWARETFVAKDDITGLKVIGPLREAAQVRESNSRAR